MLISTITQKGQVTIPKTIRNALQLKTNDIEYRFHRCLHRILDAKKATRQNRHIQQ